MKRVIVPFFIPHQGCPHDCVFCNQRALTAAASELPSAAAICETIDAFRRSAGVKSVEVAFYGGTFTALPLGTQRPLLAPLQPLLASGAVSAIRVSTRPDAIDSRNVAFLQEMQVDTVEIGVQSMDDRVLLRAGRGHTAADTVNALVTLKRAGIRVGGQLMPGLPGGTPDEAFASLARVLSLKPDFLRIYPTVVVAATRLAEEYAAGTYRPWGLDEAVTCCAALVQRSSRAGVTVIRVGLQPTDDLAEAGAILAGPFHPAFRQLVETERWYRLLLLLCDGVPAGETVVAECAPSRVADLVGHRRQNVLRVTDAFGLARLRVTPSPGMGEGALLVRWESEIRQGNLLDLEL